MQYPIIWCILSFEGFSSINFKVFIFNFLLKPFYGWFNLVVASFVIWNVKLGGGGFKFLWHKLEMKVETLKKKILNI